MGCLPWGMGGRPALGTALEDIRLQLWAGQVHRGRWSLPSRQTWPVRPGRAGEVQAPLGGPRVQCGKAMVARARAGS